MRLPQVSIQPATIDWTGLSRRFMNPNELETLVTLLRSVDDLRCMIEFGVNEGRTAKAILREIPGIQSYVGVDVAAGYIPSKVVQRNEVPAQPGHLAASDKRFSLIVRPRGSLDLTAEDLPAADAVFIDGDHGREAVMYDTALALAIVRPGGIVLWHDYHDLRGRDGVPLVDVGAVLDELHADGLSLSHVENTWLAFHKVT
jgi:predicted O-methyltransferase YrrM